MGFVVFELLCPVCVCVFVGWVLVCICLISLCVFFVEVLQIKKCMPDFSFVTLTHEIQVILSTSPGRKRAADAKSFEAV